MLDPVRELLPSAGPGPPPRAQLPRDSARRLRDGRGEPARRAARQDAVGVADNANGADGMPGVVEDRSGDAGLAEVRFVALARDPPFADSAQFGAEGLRRERLAGQLGEL